MSPLVKPVEEASKVTQLPKKIETTVIKQKARRRRKKTCPETKEMISTLDGIPTRKRLPFITKLGLIASTLLFSILLLSSFSSSRHTSSHYNSILSTSSQIQPVHGCQSPQLTLVEPRERACVLLLLRESDLKELLPTLRNFENRFNKQFRYPYVIISSPDEPPLSSTFQQTVRKLLPEGALVEFGQVEEKDWRIPEELDEKVIREGFVEMEKNGVQYAGREGYHHMCRWYSGLFARHELLLKYDWYWRLEPGGE